MKKKFFFHWPADFLEKYLLNYMQIIVVVNSFYIDCNFQLLYPPYLHLIFLCNYLVFQGTNKNVFDVIRVIIYIYISFLLIQTKFDEKNKDNAWNSSFWFCITVTFWSFISNFLVFVTDFFQSLLIYWPLHIVITI